MRYFSRAMLIASTSFYFSLSASAQNISLKANNITVKDAIEQVKKKSGYSFVFSTSDVNTKKRVTLSLQNAKIDEAVRQILRGQENVDYDLQGKTVVLKKDNTVKKGGNISKGNATHKITGRVLDSKGEPIIGASLKEDGTSNGTITDINGSFVINVDEDTPLLVISSVGFTTQKVRGHNDIIIKLNESAQALDEVVVTALGIKRKSKALGYNLTEIKSDELTAVKDPNFVNSLTGKVAGLQINSSSSGLGGSTKVVMRGMKSISKSNNVLYVVDGVPLNNTNGGDTETEKGFYTEAPQSEGIADFNPEDIESMSVLTGPSAAALYGSNAANGAILITTKKGVAGKAKLTFSHSTDFSKPLVMPEFQTTYGNKKGEFASWGDKLSKPSSYSPEDFLRTGYQTNTSLSLSTGTKQNQTFASLAATLAEGIIPNNTYSRYNFTVRNSSKMLSDKLSLDLGFSYVMQKSQNMLSQGQYYNPLVPVYLFPRGDDFNEVKNYERYDEIRQLNTQYWPYGELGMAMQNPYWVVNRNMFNTDKDRYMFNVGLKYQIYKWLDISGRVRMDNATTTQTKKLYASTDAKYSQSEKGFYQTQKIVEKQTYADLLLNINKRFGNFDLVANIGASIQDLRYDSNGAKGQISLIPNFFALHNIDLTANNSGVLQDGWKEQTQSVFGSAELGWKSMVYLNVTARNDWASALVNTSSSSFFYPSVGLSGIITEMLKLPSWLTFWKVRASYSSVGNAPSRYLTIPTFGYNIKGEFQTNTHMPVPKLYPERTKSFEFGTNFKLFNGMLEGDLTYYKSNTYNQTFEAKASSSSGYSTFYIQAGDIANWGIEASLTFRRQFNKLHWESQATFSMNRNKIQQLVRNYPDPITGELLNIPSLEVSTFGNYRMILEEGGSMGDIYVTSKLKTDENGEIYLDPETKQLQTVQEVQKVGNVNPRYNIGFRNNFEWNGFSLGFLINARIGGKVMSATQAIMDAYGVSKQSAIARDNGGIHIGSEVIDSEYYYEYVGGGDTGMLINYVYSATNVRLQEMTLGYSLPKKWFNNRLNMTISLIGRNLWMIYNKAPYDPESIAFTGNYFQGLDYFMQPSLRNIGFSVRLNF